MLTSVLASPVIESVVSVTWLNNPFVPAEDTAVTGVRRCWKLSYLTYWRERQTALSQ